MVDRKVQINLAPLDIFKLKGSTIGMPVYLEIVLVTTPGKLQFMAFNIQDETGDHSLDAELNFSYRG